MSKVAHKIQIQDDDDKDNEEFFTPVYPKKDEAKIIPPARSSFPQIEIIAKGYVSDFHYEMFSEGNMHGGSKDEVILSQDDEFWDGTGMYDYSFLYSQAKGGGELCIWAMHGYGIGEFCFDSFWLIFPNYKREFADKILQKLLLIFKTHFFNDEVLLLAGINEVFDEIKLENLKLKLPQK